MMTNNNVVNNKKFSSYAIYVSPDTVNQQVKNKVVELFIPYEISIEVITLVLNSKYSEYANQPGWIEKCHQFLVKLYFKQITELYDDGYVPLMSSILGEAYGDKKTRTPFYYKTIVESLINCELLVVNKFYEKSTLIKKGASMGYRLSLKYPDKMVKLNVGGFSFNIKRSNLDFHDQLKRLTLDEFEFFSILSVVPNSYVLRGFHFFNSWVHGEFYSFNDKNGRVHTQLHSLNRVFRSTIRFNQKPLHEVDVSSCQPFLLLSVVEQSLNYRKKKKYKLVQWAQKTSDLNLYIKLIQDGDLYLYLLTKIKGLKKISPKIKPVELDDFKEKFFAQVMFARELNDKNKLVKVFQAEFPTVYKAFLYYQKQNPEIHLANHLQQLETLVVENALKDLNLSPNDIALRYHDAVLSNSEITADIREALQKQLLNVIGVEGRVKVKLWGDDLQTVLTDRRFNPLLLGNTRNWAAKKRRNADIRKAIGKKGVSGADAAEFTNALHQYYDHCEWRQDLESRIKEVKLRYPNDYNLIEVEAFKKYMSSEVVQAQDTFLALHPELEILRDSRTNRLYRELRIVS
jgi:hypothetical protein